MKWGSYWLGALLQKAKPQQDSSRTWPVLKLHVVFWLTHHTSSQRSLRLARSVAHCPFLAPPGSRQGYIGWQSWLEKKPMTRETLDCRKRWFSGAREAEFLRQYCLATHWERKVCSAFKKVFLSWEYPFSLPTFRGQKSVIKMAQRAEEGGRCL